MALRLSLIVFIASLLAGCGQKGDLYLPEAEQTPDTETQETTD